MDPKADLPLQPTSNIPDPRHLDRAIAGLGAADACGQADETELRHLIHSIALFRILRRELEVPANRDCLPAWLQLYQLTDEFVALDRRIAQLPTTVQLALNVFQLVQFVEGIVPTQYFPCHTHDASPRATCLAQLRVYIFESRYHLS